MAARYKCKYCGEEFSAAEKLVAHEDTHRAEEMPGGWLGQAVGRAIGAGADIARGAFAERPGERPALRIPGMPTAPEMPVTPVAPTVSPAATPAAPWSPEDFLMPGEEYPGYVTGPPYAGTPAAQVAGAGVGGLPPIGEGELPVPTRYETVVESGRVLLVVYDQNGEIYVDIDGRPYIQDIGDADPEGITEWQQAQIDRAIADATAEAEHRASQLAFQEQELAAQLGISREELELQRQYQQWQQQEAERRYGAELAAKPMAWLQHAAYTGQQPVVQPWMQPLMPQQYEQLGAGQPIPGWQAPAAGQMYGQAPDMTGMPELTTPSAQYWARMGPTAQQQLLGYRQARTGARPEETQFRRWSAAPPSGQYRGLTRAR